jgi:hypothetical protein
MDQKDLNNTLHRHAAQIAALESAICPRVEARLKFLERQLSQLGQIEERLTVNEERMKDVHPLYTNPVFGAPGVGKSATAERMMADYANAMPSVPTIEDLFKRDPSVGGAGVDAVRYGSGESTTTSSLDRVEKIARQMHAILRPGSDWDQIDEEVQLDNMRAARKLIKIVETTK